MFKAVCARNILKTSWFTRERMGTLLSSELGKAKGMRRRSIPLLNFPSLVQVGSLEQSFVHAAIE